MGIRFLCVNCDKKVHVKDFLAGKRGRCPHCDGKIRIPKESTISSSKEQKEDPEVYAPGSLEVPNVDRESSHPADEVTAPARESSTATQAPPIPAKDSTHLLLEDPTVSWYVAPPSGGQYGPANAKMMQTWISEGRISDDSLVWREGWSDWEPATKILGDSAKPPTPPAPKSPSQSTAKSQQKIDKLPDASSVHRYKLSRNRSRMMGILLIVALAIVSIGLAILLFYVLRSNP